MGHAGTRSEILDLARGYLQRLGYNGFSFQTIADDLGIKKASVHYHFASKEELGLALIDEYINAFHRWSKKVAAESSALKRLRAYFLIFERFAKDRSKICPLGVFCADFHTLPKALQGKMGELHSVQREWLIANLAEAKARGEIGESVSPKEASDAILSSLQGALQIARLRGVEPLSRLRRFLFRALDANFKRGAE